MYLEVTNGLKCLETFEDTIAQAETKACALAAAQRWLWFRVHELP